MASTDNTPQKLAPGAYWGVVPGKAPAICEKREGEGEGEGEDFVRFTNGSRQTCAREGEKFVGPIPAPTN